MTRRPGRAAAGRRTRDYAAASPGVNFGRDRVVTPAAGLHYTALSKPASWQTSNGCRVIQEASQKLSGEAIILMYHHCAPVLPWPYRGCMDPDYIAFRALVCQSPES